MAANGESLEIVETMPVFEVESFQYCNRATPLRMIGFPPTILTPLHRRKDYIVVWHD